jgi:hypothetical protein
MAESTPPRRVISMHPGRESPPPARQSTSGPSLYIRYWKRMRPNKVYAVTVSLAGRGEAAPVTLRLLMAGAQVVPAEQVLNRAKGVDRATFYVTPLARGRLRGEHVEVLQDGNKIQELRIPSKVCTQWPALRWLFLAFFIPWLILHFLVYSPIGYQQDVNKDGSAKYVRLPAEEFIRVPPVDKMEADKKKEADKKEADKKEADKKEADKKQPDKKQPDNKQPGKKQPDKKQPDKKQPDKKQPDKEKDGTKADDKKKDDKDVGDVRIAKPRPETRIANFIEDNTPDIETFMPDVSVDLKSNYREIRRLPGDTYVDVVVWYYVERVPLAFYIFLFFLFCAFVSFVFHTERRRTVRGRPLPGPAE